MIGWIPYPMIRIAAFFTAGILVGIYQPDGIPENSALIVFAALGMVLIISSRSGRSGLVSGLAGLLAIAIGGYLQVLHHNESRRPDHLLHVADSIQYYTGTLSANPEDRAKSWRLTLRIHKIRTKDTWNQATGSVVVYISKKEKATDLHYGDELMITGMPEEIKAPANPGEFDFKKFMSYKNTSHQQFVKRNQINVIQKSPERGVTYYSHQARSWSTAQIKRYVHGGQEQGIALALVLGVNDGLDNELQNSYAASGSLHVLSVSGLHVGIIYLVILILLKPIRSISWSRWLVAGISLVCLWSYAFITGLSPSVLRAVTMFSFVALARPFGRQTNIYNTLAASFFLLLLYDPFLIMSVGFQLSYLAVLGIVYMQRPLYNLWSPDFWLWDKVWEATCISIAAQLATFSLGLFYFHQFPVYFLIANLFVIPVSFVVLVSGIVLLAVSPFSFPATCVGWMLEMSIRFLNFGVFMFEDMPWSVIQGVNISLLQCLLLMAFVLTWIMFFEFRKIKLVVVSAVMAFVFSWAAWQNNRYTMQREQWIVYSIPGHSAMEWIQHRKALFMADSSLLKDPSSLRFHIYPNRLLNDVHNHNVTLNSSPESSHVFSGFSIFFWQGRSVLWITDRKQKLPMSIHVDYVLISNRAIGSLKTLKKNVSFERMILDGSNPGWFSRRIMQEAKVENIPVHSVLDQGAFVVTM